MTVSSKSDALISIDDFDYLEVNDKGISVVERGCGCCGEFEPLRKELEIAYIRRYLDNLKAEIAVWNNILWGVTSEPLHLPK